VSNHKRSERLAVLKDRADRRASEPGDLAESLQIAREAATDSAELERKLTEVGGWQTLLQENTSQLQRSSSLCDAFEDLLKPLAAKEAAKAKFFGMLATPKIFLPLIILIIILAAALIGIVTIEPIRLALPLGG